MKNILLILNLFVLTFNIEAQIVVRGISPASIVNNYQFTWASPTNNSGWATPNFYNSGVHVQSTLMLVEDGTPGTNNQGHPISQEGCNYPLINDLSGKIAVVYRNTCDFSTKAWYAQMAGAVGVIIINNAPSVTLMSSGSYGFNVTIPVVMLSSTDGATLVSEMANGPVVVWIGNLQNLFANNITLSSGNALAPKAGMIHSELAQNGNDFNFDVGARIRNFGNQSQSNVSLNAKILNPSGAIVYNQTVSGLTINSGDSIDVFPGQQYSFPQFNLTSYPLGDYTLTYTVNMNATDEYIDDNQISNSFSINDSIFSYSKPSGGTLNNVNHYRLGYSAANGYPNNSVCTVIKDPNASRVAITGLYFSARKTTSLVDEPIALKLYKWDDDFIDLNDSNFGFNNLNEVAYGWYGYQSDLQGEVVYGSFDSPIALENNQRYLACATIYNNEIYLGFDNTDYTYNTEYYLQPMFPVQKDGGYYPSFNSNKAFSGAIGVKLSPCPVATAITINQTACDSYTSSSGQTYFETGVYLDTVNSYLGCDSLYQTINLTILNSSTSSFSATICYGDTYAWNGQYYSQQGLYTQTLTNQIGCDSVVTLVLNIINNDYIYLTPNPSFGNAPLNVAFANQTANLSNYNFTWYFGDGTSQQSNAPFLSHTYTQDGYADVTVVAENLTTGCSSSQTFDDLIFVIGGLTCTHSASLNQTTALIGCTGDSILLSCNTDPSFSYQWNRNGVPVSGATTSSFYPTQSGSYTVTIYQNNCPVTSAGISVTVNPLPSVPTITSNGTITPCSGGTMTLSAPSGFSSYFWNTGSTSSSLVVSQSGNYSVTVTNNNGCSRTSNPFVVNASFMAAPQVCIVGVDSLTNENRLVWEKPLTLGIDSFYVYKETNVSNVYTKIGATDYNDLAVFLDVNSNPAVQAYRYKISAKDTCGVETNVGDFHKTIHLTINQGIGGAWNLIWSHYEGLTFGSYKIYRGTDPSNISLLTTIQSNLNSYSDLTPPIGPLYYQIEVVNPVNCDPTKIVNYGVSRSNIVNNGVSGVIEISNSNILVYPNPTNSNITLEVSSELVGRTYSIQDFSGRIILNGKISSTQEQIDLQHVARGAYYLSIENSSSETKLIKQ